MRKTWVIRGGVMYVALRSFIIYLKFIIYLLFSQTDFTCWMSPYYLPTVSLPHRENQP